DTYMLNLEHHNSTPSDFPSMTNAQRMTASRSGPDLHWTGINVQGASGDKTAGVYGTHVQMYGPNPAESGSSVSHFNTAVAPDELMEPFYTGPNHHPGLTVELFQDIGWQLNPEYCPNLPVGIVDVPPVYYTVLQDAYDAMVSGDTIQSQAIVFIENLLIDMNISVTLNGGYDCDYNDPPSGETTLNGNMTISDGTLIIEDGTFTVH
ncbi:MAG: hypothetical protein JSW20_05140, partial [Nitrospiraceae bacterium]